MVFKYLILVVHFRLSRSTTSCALLFSATTSSGNDPAQLLANKMKLTDPACVPAKNGATAVAGETAASCPVSCIASGGIPYSKTSGIAAAFNTHVTGTGKTIDVQCDTTDGTWKIEYSDTANTCTTIADVGEKPFFYFFIYK